MYLHQSHISVWTMITSLTNKMKATGTRGFAQHSQALLGPTAMMHVKLLTTPVQRRNATIRVPIRVLGSSMWCFRFTSPKLLLNRVELLSLTKERQTPSSHLFTASTIGCQLLQEGLPSQVQVMARLEKNPPDSCSYPVLPYALLSSQPSVAHTKRITSQNRKLMSMVIELA